MIIEKTLEHLKEHHDYDSLKKIVRKNIAKPQHNALPNGIICLKGGDLQAETRPFHHIVELTDISGFFSEEWFKEKFVIYLPV
jgi:16S rRNA (guanine527-N7)-methyltransferase